MDRLLRRTGAFGYAAVIRHIPLATSRRSAKIILDSNLGILAFIHGQARGLLRRRINQDLRQAAGYSGEGE
jgi:hypothetical protein